MKTLFATVVCVLLLSGCSNKDVKKCDLHCTCKSGMCECSGTLIEGCKCPNCNCSPLAGDK